MLSIVLPLLELLRRPLACAARTLGLCLFSGLVILVNLHQGPGDGQTALVVATVALLDGAVWIGLDDAFL